MKLLFAIAALLLAAATTGLADQVLTDDTGDINSYYFGNADYQIRAKKEYKVVLEITNLSLRRYGSYISIQDGRYGEESKYTMRGSDIWMHSGGQYTKASLPVKFETVNTRKIFIRQRVGFSEGFVAHYTSYTEEGTCLKNDMEIPVDDVISAAWDTDDLSPVASRYEVTRRCGLNYQQYSTTSTCEGGTWVGSTSCHARADLLERCTYDFDNLTISENCPYTIDDAISYYMEVEELDIEDGEGLGRSSIQRRNRCGPYCARDRVGRYMKRNCMRAGKNVRLRCMLCRFKFRCSGNYAFGG